MKLELKAYRCIFPSLFDYGEDPFNTEDPEEYQLIYGKTQKEAVKNRCFLDENCTYWEMKQAIRTRRHKEGDLYSQDKSELLKHLSDKLINHLTHSLGVQIGDVYRGEFYRNYSAYYEKNEECEALVTIGLMDHWQKLDSEVYGVSKVGIEAVKTLLLIIK